MATLVPLETLENRSLDLKVNLVALVRLEPKGQEVLLE